MDKVFAPSVLKESCARQALERYQSKDVTWVVYAACRADTIVFEQFDWEYPKDRVGILVVVFDLFSVISILVFVKIIKMRQSKFIA